jgi:hypothetical protein
MKNSAVILAVWLTAGGVAGALQVLTFDDLPAPASAPDYHALIPDGYGGLHWCGPLAYYNPLDPRRVPNTFYAGDEVGVVSQDNLALTDGFGNPVEVSGDSLFSLISGYFTPRVSDGLQLEVQGYNGDTLLYDNTYTLSLGTPTLITFNYLGVNDLWFTSFGGISPPGLHG